MRVESYELFLKKKEKKNKILMLGVFVSAVKDKKQSARNSMWVRVMKYKTLFLCVVSKYNVVLVGICF